MRKLVMLISVLCLLLPLMADYDWELTERWVVEAGDVAWFQTDHTVRAGAANPRTGNVLVPSRTAGTAVHILNGRNGSYIGTLPEPAGGFTGGTFAINQIAALPSGRIVVKNLQVGGGTAKIYLYDSETDTDPEIYETTVAYRTGDSLAAREDLYGNLEILTGRTSSALRVRRGANGVWRESTITLEGVNNNYSAGFYPDGSLIISTLAGDPYITRNNRDGSLIGPSVISQPQVFIGSVYSDIDGFNYIGVTPRTADPDFPISHPDEPNVSIYNAQTGVRVATKDITEYIEGDRNFNGAGSAIVYTYSYTPGGFTKLYIASICHNNYIGVWEIQAPVDVDSWELY